MLFTLLILMAQQPSYEKVYIFTHGTRQDTVLNDYNGDGYTDVLNTSVDFSENPPVRWLFVHFGLNGRFNKTADVMIVLPDKAVCLVFGDFDEKDGIDICFIASDGVYYYPFENKTISEEPKKLLHVKTFFTSGALASIPIWSFQDDLDGNKLHDIVIPIPSGYKVYLQTKKGLFGKTESLESEIKEKRHKVTSPEEFIFKDRIELSFFSYIKVLPRLTLLDMTGDGRKDIAVLSQDRVTIFEQGDNGKFTRRKPRFVPALKSERTKDTVEVSNAFFVDVNKDSVQDLVIVRNKGTFGALGSVETHIFILYGNGKGDFVAQKSLNVPGISLNPQFIDLDNDGFVDIFASRINTDILKKILEKILMGDVEIYYDVYQFIPTKGEHEAVSTTTVFLKLNDVEKKPLSSLPIVTVSPDLNGDKRGELVKIDPSDHELKIFKGKEKFGHDRRPEMDFEKDPYFKVKVDRHPRYIDFNDVNQDGILDIILYHRSAIGFFLSTR